jgi:hypothetical protein
VFRILLVAIGLCVVATVATAAYDFSRYQVILDREPFGSPPPAPPVAAEPVEPAQPDPSQGFVRELRLCAIRETADGELRVGFVNIRKKPEKFYWLYVGETSDDGIEVLDADYGEEKAQLRKDGHEFWLEMGGVATAAAPAAKARRGTRGRSSASRTPSPRSGSSGVKPPQTSYLARLRERQEERKQRALAMLARRDAQSEEMKVAEEKRLREYNLNLIREGMPALPITLTKDEDDTLVSEGVLPAAE